MGVSALLDAATDAAVHSLDRVRNERIAADPTGLAVGGNPTLRDLVARGRAADVVWLAAVLEKFMKGSTYALLVEIKSQRIPLQMLRPSLAALMVEFSALAALRDYQRVWQARLAVVETSSGLGALDFDFTEPPLDGATIREHHLATVWKIFGLPNTHLPSPRVGGALKDIADSRNNVAHGDEDSLAFGRNRTNSDLLSLIEAASEIVLHVFLSMDRYLRDSMYLRLPRHTVP